VCSTCSVSLSTLLASAFAPLRIPLGILCNFLEDSWCDGHSLFRLSAKKICKPEDLHSENLAATKVLREILLTRTFHYVKVPSFLSSSQQKLFSTSGTEAARATRVEPITNESQGILEKPQHLSPINPPILWNKYLQYSFLGIMRYLINGSGCFVEP
jgi:hypothetical protein